MRKVNLLGAAILALTTGAWSYGAVAQTAAPDNSATPSPAPDNSATPSPAPDNSSSAPADTSSSDTGTKPAKKTMHHHAGHMSHSKMGKDSAAGDAAVDDLNAQSLDAAKGGKSFSPPTTMAGEGSASSTSTKHAMKHTHHKMAKKTTPASGDTSGSSAGSSSGSSDTSSTPPADNSGK